MLLQHKQIQPLLDNLCFVFSFWHFLYCYWAGIINGTEEVGNAAAFLASPLASAITGAVVYVDNGLNAMGVGVDSPIFENLDIPKGN